MFKIRFPSLLLLAAFLSVTSFSAGATSPAVQSSAWTTATQESQMSYSIGAKASTKAAALESLAQRFDEVLVHQPIHSADRCQALAAAQSFVDLLEDSATKDIQIRLGGSVWSVDGEPRSVDVNVSVSYVDRPTDSA